MPSIDELLKKLQSGDEDALFPIVMLYYNDLYRYGVKFIGDVNDTKDLLNGFFIHIWYKRSQLYGIENPKAYFMVAFKRFLIEHLRKSGRSRLVSTDITESDTLLVSSYEEYLVAAIRDRELKDILYAAIHSLPARQRQLIELRFYEQLSFEEIAERTSLSVRTVYNKLHEGIKKLRTSDLPDRIRKIIFF